MLFSLLVLLADDPPKVDGAAPPWAGFVPIFLMLIALYFLVLLPQQRKDRKHREMLSTSLKKNDEVITAGGIIGIVQAIKDGDEVVIKLEDNARMRILKSSIVRIVPRDVPTTTPT